MAPDFVIEWTNGRWDFIFQGRPIAYTYDYGDAWLIALRLGVLPERAEPGPRTIGSGHVEGRETPRTETAR